MRKMAKAAKCSRLLPSGYDEEFVSAVEEDFHCLICHLPLKEPVQTRCGHRFCKDCLYEYFRRQEAQGLLFTCPADRENLHRDRDVFPDKATERKILSLAIKCPSDGCDWTGELRYKEDHFEECCKCLVACPNSCGILIQRKMISNHTIKDCPLALISCPYVRIGCKRKIERREVESHVQSAVKPHLDLACVKIKDTEEKLETRVFIWKINNFGKCLRQARAEVKLSLESDPFFTDRIEKYGYKLRVVIYPNGQKSGKNTHLSVYFYPMKGEYDAILPWPFKKKVKFTLIDQQEDPAKRENVTRQVSLYSGSCSEGLPRPTGQERTTGYGFSQFISHEKLHSRCYLVDDTLFLQVEVGPLSS